MILRSTVLGIMLLGAAIGAASLAHAVPPAEVPVTVGVEPGEGISPGQARSPLFLLDRNDELIVLDQIRGFFLGRFLPPLGLAPESPAFPGGVGLEYHDFAGPPLPAVPLTFLRPQVGFPFTAAGSLAGSPCIADLDRDGHCEVIVATTEGHVYLLARDGEIPPGWPIEIDDGFYAPPSVGDLDGDGTGEIILGGVSGWLYAWRMDGSWVPGWPQHLALPGERDAGAELYGAAAVGDVDRDGRDEVCVATAAGTVWLLEGDGKSFPGWPKSLPHAMRPPNPGGAFASPAFGDLDGDGRPEIALATNAYEMYAWEVTGEPLPGWPVRIPNRARAGFSDVAIGDVDGDGEPELVITSEHGFTGPATVSVWEADGSLADGWPYDLPEPCNAGAALGDLTGDGIPEIVAATIGGSSTVVVLDGEGAEPLPGWPLSLKRQTVNASPVIADLDGDGWNDIALVSLCTGRDTDAWVWAIDHEGNPLDGFPIMLPHDEIVRAAPATSDLDGDGDLELIVVTERLNSLYVWDLDALCDPALMPWPGVAGGPTRCSCLMGSPGSSPSQYWTLPDPSGGPPEPPYASGDDRAFPSGETPWQSGPSEPPPLGTGLLGGQSLNSGGDAMSGTAEQLSTVSFELGEETDVRLRIFNIQQQPIRRLLRHKLPPGRYSIYWDGRNDNGEPQPSGIYFYQLGLDRRARTRQLLLLK
jgi:hypothetical protein